MDEKKWSELAWKYAKTSNKKGLSGVELDDLYQCAMIGIFLASKTYNKKKGKFSSYAHWYIIKEIHNMIYNRYSEPKQQEEYTEEEEWFDGLEDEMVWVVDFLNSIKLKDKHKVYLYNIMTFGETAAIKMYVDEHGVTRSRAYQVRNKIREIASEYYRRTR